MIPGHVIDDHWNQNLKITNGLSVDKQVTKHIEYIFNLINFKNSFVRVPQGLFSNLELVLSWFF